MSTSKLSPGTPEPRRRTSPCSSIGYTRNFLVRRVRETSALPGPTSNHDGWVACPQRPHASPRLRNATATPDSTAGSTSRRRAPAAATLRRTALDRTLRHPASPGPHELSRAVGGASRRAPPPPRPIQGGLQSHSSSAPSSTTFGEQRPPHRPLRSGRYEPARRRRTNLRAVGLDRLPFAAFTADALPRAPLADWTDVDRRYAGRVQAAATGFRHRVLPRLPCPRLGLHACPLAELTASIERSTPP